MRRKITDFSGMTPEKNGLFEKLIREVVSDKVKRTHVITTGEYDSYGIVGVVTGDSPHSIAELYTLFANEHQLVDFTGAPLSDINAQAWYPSWDSGHAAMEGKKCGTFERLFVEWLVEKHGFVEHEDAEFCILS